MREGEPIPGGPLHLVAVTPEATVYDGPADLVVVPAHDGEVAFLPGHAAYVGLLGAGEMRFHVPEGPGGAGAPEAPGGGTRRFFLEGGVVQTADDVVNVLADAVVPAESIDSARAQADLDRALSTPAVDDEAQRARQRAADSARARLRLASRHAGARRPAQPLS